MRLNQQIVSLALDGYINELEYNLYLVSIGLEDKELEDKLSKELLEVGNIRELYQRRTNNE